MIPNVPLDPVESYLAELSAEGWQAVQSWLARSMTEGQFLDFKRTNKSDYSDAKALDPNDAKNLAKAISGFGNADGGVLVLGIETGNEDQADSLVPISGHRILSSLVNRGISRLVDPPPPGIRVEVVDDPNDTNRGIVVVVIPRHEGLPIQVVNTRVFYARSGESHQLLSHGVLAGMFGRRPSPRVQWLQEEAAPAIEARPNNVELTIWVPLANRGRGIARELFVTAEAKGLGPKDRMELSTYDQTHWENTAAYGGRSNLISTSGYRLGQGQRAMVGGIRIFMFSPARLNVSLTIGAEGQAPEHYRMRWDCVAIRSRFPEHGQLVGWGHLRQYCEDGGLDVLAGS